TGFAIGALAFLRQNLDPLELLVLALLSAFVMRYVLPKMHDRYFCVAEVLAFVLMAVRPLVWTVAVFLLMQLAALNVYAWYFFRAGSAGWGALLNSCVLLILLFRVVSIFRRSAAAERDGELGLG